MFLADCRSSWARLSLTVPGNTGFGSRRPDSETPDEAAQILTLLSIAAVFMGTALTIRDLIGERPIFRREQAVGLSTGAYLSAKVMVFCVFASIQAAITTVMVILGKGAPTESVVLLGNPTFELFVPSPLRAWPRRSSGWCCRRSPAPTSRSCRCWWCR